MTPIRIPLSAPDVIETDIEAVVNVLRTPRLSLGPELEAFEREMAQYAGADHAIAVSSGTSGLHLCMRAFGIGEGDEVIVPSFTFIAAANVIRMAQANPVFVDIDPDTLNIDPSRVAAAITPRTRAILAVHTFGRPAAMTHLLAIAQQHGLVLIEDACEAIGAEYRGRKVGVLGNAGVFGFYPNKQITTGEGGMIVTNESGVAQTARSLRNQGRVNSEDWLDHAHVGYNCRLSEINCALGRSQLQRLEEILQRRAAVAAWYNACLGGHPDLIVPDLEFPDGRLSWFVYVVRLAARFHRAERDTIIRTMGEAGIECGRYFAPIHMQPAYRNLPPAGNCLAITEEVAQRCIALPFFNRISHSDVRQVCRSLEDALKRSSPSER